MHDTIAAPADLVWIEVDDDFWTASVDGNHVGVVEFTHGHFVVVDALGRPAGVSHSLGGAKILLAEASDDADAEDADLLVRFTRSQKVAAVALGLSTISAIVLASGLVA